MRAGHVLAAAALALAALGLVAAGAAQAQPGTEDPPGWFSPVSGGVGPGDHGDAWHLRTHLQVESSVDQPVGTPVQVHLDLGREALAAGWPAETGGEVPRLFTLDPDSVTLVRYDHNWEPVEVVPAHVDTGWYERDQTERYDRSQESAFHPKRNPIVTVEWRLMEEIQRSARDYVLQFDTVENHGVPPVEAPSYEEERVDALYWVGPGTVLHGSHPGTADNDVRPTLTILGTEDGTEVEVVAYDGGFAFPGEYGQRGNPDQAPFTLDEGETEAWSFGTQPTLFRIEATEPVIAFEHGLQAGGSGDFVPSTDGDLLGTDFRVPPGTGQVYLIAPAPRDEGEGDEAIGFQASGLTEEGTNCGGQVHPPGTSVHSYYCRLAAQEEKIGEIQADEPVLVQYVPAGNARVQAPAVTGSPVGETFLAATTNQGQGGVSVQGHQAPATVGFHDPAQGSSKGQVTAEVQEPTEQATSGWNAAPGANHGETVPHRAQSQSPEEPILVRADGGQGNQQTTPLGGSHGQRFQGAVPISVQPFYDVTDVEVTFPNAPGASFTKSLSNARAMTVDESRQGVETGDPVLVEASKPISVVPIDHGLRQYSRFLAAQPLFDDAQVLSSEYRGYLVDVRPASGQSPVLVEASPGEEVEVPFLVQNLGRWDGEPLADRIELEATPTSDTWEVDTRFEDAAPSLTDNEARENALNVTLPKEMPAGEQVTVRVEGTSANNEEMTSAFDALLLSQTAFGVDLWIGSPEDRDAGSDDTEVRLEPGENTTVELAVMNTGTTSDAYDLSVDGASGGWEATIVKDGVSMDQVGPLEPGEVEALELEVRALDLVEIGSRALAVRADSVGSSERAQVRVDARLAGQQAIGLSAPAETRTVEPGTTTTFPVTAENVGETDMTGVTFGLERALPDGWSAHLAGDVDLVNESQALPTGDAIEAPVEVRVDADASADETGSILVEARNDDAGASLPLSVQAAHERDVVASAPEEVEVAPGGNASLEVRLENLGNGEEALQLVSVSQPGAWNVTTRDPDPIAAFGGAANATVVVEAPEDAPAGPAPIRLQAVGAGGLRVHANVTATVQPVGALAWGEVPDLLARAGGSLEQPLALTNHGNVPANVSVTASVGDAWGLDAQPGTLEIPPGATRVVTIAGPVPASAEGDHEIDVTAASKQGATASTQIPVEVVQPTLELAELNVPDPPEREGDVVFVSALLHNPGPTPVVDAQVRLQADNETLDTASFASIGPNGTVVAPLKWTHEAGASPPQVAWGTVREDGFVEAGSETLPVEDSKADEQDEDRLVPWPGVVPVAVAVVAAASAVAWRRRG